MKKKLVFVLLLLLFPSLVMAKECNVVVGDGKKIGSEIACGNEHFYVIDVDGDNIKMLAKYNLYVGNIYNKVKLDINKTYIRYEVVGNSETNATYFFEGEQVSDKSIWETRIKEKYNLERSFSDYSYRPSEIEGSKYEIDGKTYINKTYKFYPFISITESTEGYALQNELALGVTGEKGNANYPIYGTLNLFSIGAYSETKNHENFVNGYINFEFDETRFKSDIVQYLKDYGTKLSNMGFEISNVDMINMKELNNLVYTVSGKNLPLSEWYNASLNSEEIEDEIGSYNTLGDLKQYLSNDYSWLWNTTYWTKTVVGNEIKENDLDDNKVYFVSSTGEICYSDSCFTLPRAGLRPVVTINKANLKYLIRVVTDGNGTVEAVSEASGGDEIIFKVSNKKGYKLSTLTVETDSGETVEFSSEDITQKEDGSVSISTNKFTMPYENLTITAKWSPVNNNILINPKTWGNSYVVFLVTMLLSGIYVYFYGNKKNIFRKN